MDEKKSESFPVPETMVLKVMLAQTQLEKIQAQAQLVKQQQGQLEADIKALVTEGGKYTWNGSLNAETMTAERTPV